MTGSGVKISRQLNERLPLDAQLPQRLFVSRTLTLAILCPMRIANGRARRVSSAWARVARWSRTRRGICCGSPRTQISPPAIITGGAQGSRDRRIRCGTPSTGTIAPSTNGTTRGKASSRATIHPCLLLRKRRPSAAGTPCGNTSSTRRSAASIRSPMRRARGLTRTDTGTPRLSAAACRPISVSANSLRGATGLGEKPLKPAILLPLPENLPTQVPNRHKSFPPLS